MIYFECNRNHGRNGKPIVRWGHKAADPENGWLGCRIPTGVGVDSPAFYLNPY